MVIFSDQSNFVLNVHVNRQAYRYWARQNPHWIEEHNIQYPQKGKVRGGIFNNHIKVLYFFEKSLSSA